MKLSECNMCNLCQSRLHTSFDKGVYPANVLIVFGKEPSQQINRTKLDLFVKRLNDFLKQDWHYTFAIKCFSKKKIKKESIINCRKWLSVTFNKVDPYLVILMGKQATRAVLGDKYKTIPKDIFYSKVNKNKKKRAYFIGPSITDSPKLIENSLDKLILYIEEHYG